MKIGDNIILKGKNKFVKGREVKVIAISEEDKTYTVKGMVAHNNTFKLETEVIAK